ncbi:alpha/beta hydrolase [Paenibacillus abyssi]|uniref:Acetylesterase n=1 Tax=Paenibacillus abyssi TaxID=1340531 RepID=A0A917CRI7_9BACL|nr:alpha/beta hydrolase [Paenibacillus abyssi]GGF96499.1 acetylesterase [Paenibacillus abyssi]
MARPESVMFELWPDGAPFAQGAADEDRPALFPYLLEGDNHAAVIVCPGGGYGRRADHEGEPIARWLNSLGISAFVLRYRVAPYKYPCALLDAQRAIRYVRHHAADLKIDAQRIGILGFSAGGHLVSTAGTRYDLGNKQADDPMERLSCRPDLLVLCYPVITMKAPYTHEGSKQNLLGEAPEDEYIQQLSNELHVTADTPPTFLWHTSEDQAVPVENSLMFASALSRAKVPFDLHVYDHGGHGLGMAEHDEHIANWTAVCGKWLKTQLFC